MFKSYLLNTDSSWKHLPWKKINTRVILLQRKIFEAAKKNDKLQINKIQNYFLNCNEVKIFAIENMIHSLNHYYDFYNQEKYICLDKEKFIIFKYIFSISSNTKFVKSKIVILFEKIKEYLIYLCLQPEWQARLNNNLYNNYYKQKRRSYINLIEIPNIKYKHNFNWNYLINKLKPIPYIKKYIRNWFENRYYIKTNKFCLLSYLFNQIWFLGLNWFQLMNINFNHENIFCKLTFNDNLFLLKEISFPFCNMDSQKKLNKLNSKNLNLEFVSVSNLIYGIKSRLFKKNNLNQWRFNHKVKYLKIINYIINYIKKHIISHNYNLNHNLTKKIFISINRMISYLKIKRSVLYLNINKLNFDIHIFIYQQIILIFEYNYLKKTIGSSRMK